MLLNHHEMSIIGLLVGHFSNKSCTDQEGGGGGGLLDRTSFSQGIGFEIVKLNRAILICS